MKTHTMTFDRESHISRIASKGKNAQWLSQALGSASLILLSVLPAFTLLVLFTWGSSVPSLLPYMQAITGLSGFVFLALAVDAEKMAAVLQLLSAAAMFALAFVAASVSPELLIVAAAVVAAWTVPGLYRYAGRVSGCLRLSGEG